MSFVSKDNFLAPLSNIVNLVAIIAIAGLFLLWRLMGGGFNIESARNETEIKPSTLTNNIERSPASTERLRQREERLYEQQITPPTRVEPVEDAQKKKDDASTGLEDIERLMGLR